MKRCVSKCSGIKEEACHEPCSFVNKKYCRLLSQYKMGPYPGCEVVKKESLLKVKPATKPATKPVTKPVKTLSKARVKTLKAVSKPLETVIEEKSATKPATKTRAKPAAETVKAATKTRTKTVKAVSKPATKTRVKPATKTEKSIAKTVPNTRSTLNQLSITNLVLEKMRNDKGAKEKVKELKKILDKYPSNTLFYSLDDSIQKKVIDLIKLIDEVSPEPPDNTETISDTKNTLNKIITKLEKKSAFTIQTFMKKTEGKRKALFYGTICSDSGVCLALGKERQNILNFFKFETFENAKPPYKKIGEESVNGFVKELKYEREGYSSYALLKSSVKPKSDNLAYEYLVGKYLNDVSKRFPTFIETYGLYHYPSVKERNEMKEKGTLSKRLIPLDPNDLKNVCIKSGNLCILIQYLNNTMTLYKHFKSTFFQEHFSAHVFYQIYFTLHHLRKEFTHYDLHQNNIMLYEPVDGKYIQYHYHVKNKIVSYKSKYIVKIIDYGRSFFKDSPAYYHKVCTEARCVPLCGLNKGFSSFHSPHPTLGRHGERVYGHANALYKNESYDLKTLYFLYDELKNKQGNTLDADYMKILKDTIYMKELSYYSQPGTIEDLGKSDKIHNVSDAYERWEEYITHPDRVQANENDFSYSMPIGELHIYTDGRDLEYIPSY